MEIAYAIISETRQAVWILFAGIKPGISTDIIYRIPDTSQWRHIRFYDVIIKRTRILAHLSLFFKYFLFFLYWYCCGAEFRRRAWPLGGAVESAPPNTQNSDRYPRISPKGTGPLQNHESPIIRPRGVGLIANFNIPKYPRGKATGEFTPSTDNEPLSCSNRV